MHRFRVLLAALALAPLAGCGYHLRGSLGAAEFGDVNLQAPAALRGEFASLLSAGGASLVEREQASALVRVHDERFQRRVLSVDPVTGKEREFELRYTIGFSALRANGDPLLSGQRVQVLRDFVFDRDALIGKSREEEVLRREMRRDAAAQVLRRVAAAAAAH